MEQLEKDILIKCREGDKDAFRQVVRQYQRMVFSLALKMLCNEEEAKDTVQDTFVRDWRNHLHPFGRASHPRRLHHHRHIPTDKHLGVCGYGDCNPLGDRQLGVEINSQKRSKKTESHFLYFLQKKITILVAEKVNDSAISAANYKQKHYGISQTCKRTLFVPDAHRPSC